MARQDIDKASVRSKLVPRREPYWGAPVERGLYVGFRKLDMGGNWIARYRNDEGRQVYQSLGPVSDANSYDEAKREAMRWKRRVDEGVQTDRIFTVADVCRDYTKSLGLGGRKRSELDASKTFARIVYKDSISKLRADKLKQKHVEAWIERMKAGELSGRKKCKPSPATINRHLSTFKAALNRAVSRREIPADCVIEWSSVKPLKVVDGSRELYLDLDQRRALLDESSPDLRNLLTCIALTGCRPGDPAVMQRKDYDQRNASVTFRTKGHIRTIPVSPSAKKLFDNLATDKMPKEHMFTNEGEAWSAQQWAYQLNKAVAAAGLPPETVAYTLRHCWITDAIVGGMDVVTVAKLTGTSLEMINQTYGHLVHGVARDKLATMQFI